MIVGSCSVLMGTLRGELNRYTGYMMYYSSMPRPDAPSTTRDRLLLAAGQLLHQSEDGRLSTRAICERAGVQAPTLYHHFGSKQGLLDAVINFGFSQYVQATGEEADGDDPIG